MEIKTILKDSNFIDFMNNVSKMKVDIFETIDDDKAFGIKRPKFRLSYDKVIENPNIYDDCYKFYNEAMKNLVTLHSSYTAEYPTIEEFSEALFEKLKNYVVQTSVLPSNNNASKRTLTPTETAYYDSKKVYYLRLILTQAIPNLNTLSAIKVLENSPAEEVANFIDEMESKVTELLTKLGGDTTSQPLRDTLLKEYLYSYLPESYIQGDNLTTQKIEINKTRFSGKDPKYSTTPELLKSLGFLENFILANNLGLTAKNIAFDGFRFFDISTGKSISANTKNLHTSKLASADRYLQSNFVLDEDFAKSLLTLPKKFTKIHGKNYIKTTAIVDGDTIITTKVLYRKKFVSKDPQRNMNFIWNIELGNFCKVKEYNQTKGTYSYMLFYYPDQEGEQPIQLFRIDKVEDMFKGAPASHNLRGKEKIETTLHAHTYNLIDAVLKNYTKDESLGKMDLSHIFPPNGLDYKIIEEYFDCFCGIHGQHLRKVNQSKFKGLFEKYQPIEYSSN
jgi:hypothetical protein